MSNFVAVEEWGVDPLFIACRKTFAAVLQRSGVYTRVRSNQFEHFYFGRPVSRVEIVGTIVSIKKENKSTQVFLDDGTAVMPCVQFIRENEGRGFCENIRVGDLASIRGELIFLESNFTVQLFSESYCLFLHIKHLNVLQEPNLELLHWTSALLLHETAYCHPYKRIDGLPARPSRVAKLPEACACVRTSFLPTSMALSSLSSSSSSSSSSFSSSAQSDSAAPTAAAPHSLSLRRSLQFDPLYAVRVSLLYCPCTSTGVASDPSLTFRYALLKHLGWVAADPADPMTADTAIRASPLTFHHSDLSRPGVLALAQDYARSEWRRREEAVRGISAQEQEPEPEVGCDHINDGNASNSDSAEVSAKRCKESAGADDAKMDTDEDGLGGATWTDRELSLVQDTIEALLADGVLLRKDAAYLLVGLEFLLPTLQWYVDARQISEGGTASANANANAATGSGGLAESIKYELQIAFPTIPLWRWSLCAPLLEGIVRGAP